MPCLASFFDAMSGVKKQPNFIPAINCPTSANEPSIISWFSLLLHFSHFSSGCKILWRNSLLASNNFVDMFNDENKQNVGILFIFNILHHFVRIWKVNARSFGGD